MHLQKTSRKKAKIKMCLQGPSGSGKTYSSLLLAYGLCDDWSSIAIVDSENHSAELYSNLGNYNVISLEPPFSPESYIKAIQICEEAGMQVIILDSITHEWEYILEAHASLTGNSFTNWQKIGIKHKSFIKSILGSKSHVIATIRTKQDYVLNEKNRKMIPEKVGLKSIQREGLDYEFTLVFDLNNKNQAISSKDRTGLFFGKEATVINADTGKALLKWCNEGNEITAIEISYRIDNCKTVSELISLYKEVPQFNESLKPDFEKKKRELVITSNPIN